MMASTSSVHQLVRRQDLPPDFGKEIEVRFRAPVHLDIAPLLAVSVRLAHGRPVDSETFQSFPDTSIRSDLAISAVAGFTSTPCCAWDLFPR